MTPIVRIPKTSVRRRMWCDICRRVIDFEIHYIKYITETSGIYVYFFRICTEHTRAKIENMKLELSHWNALMRNDYI